MTSSPEAAYLLQFAAIERQAGNTDTADAFERDARVLQREVPRIPVIPDTARRVGCLRVVS